METQKEVVNRASEDLFTTYEVTPQHRCVNEQGKTSREILDSIKVKIDPALLECLDYDSADSTYDSSTVYTRYIPGSRVIVYTVRGGSEGYYLHVDMIQRSDGKLKNLILMKTLGGSEDIKKLERAIWDIVDKE